jgi:hypothetical protein
VLRCYLSWKALLRRLPEQPSYPVLPERWTAPGHRQARRARSAGASSKNPLSRALWRALLPALTALVLV